MKTLKNKITLILLLLASLNKCAWNNEIIRIENKDYFLNSEGKKRNTKVSVSLDFKSKMVLIENKRVYGIKKNGYGWETAKIFLEPDGLEILQKTINNEFSSSGYKVVEKKAENVLVITIIINQFFLEPELQILETNVISIIDAEVLVIIDKKHYKRRFKSMYSLKAIYWENKYEIPIKANIDLFSKKVVSEIDNLIHQKYLKHK